MRKEWPPFRDPRVLEAVVRTAGSWERFCELLPVDGAGFVGMAKQFKTVYRVLATQQQFAAPARDVAQIGDGTTRLALDQRDTPKEILIGDARASGGGMTSVATLASDVRSAKNADEVTSNLRRFQVRMRR